MNRRIGWICFVAALFLAAGSASLVGRQTDPVSTRLRLAQNLEREGLTDQALRIYEELIAEAPEHPVVFTRLKDLYVRVGDYERALGMIEERLRRHPKEINLEVYAAQVRYKMGLTAEAMSAWEDMLIRYAGSASVYQSVATAMIGERLLDEAIEVYAMGRDRLGSDHLFAFNLASLHAARMEYGRAVDELLVYWRAHPKHVSVVESQLKRFPKTLRVTREVVKRLEAGIASSPKDAGLRQILAGVLVRAERFDEALAVVRDVERLRPEAKRGEALFGFGQDALRSGAPETAIRAFEELVSSFPAFPRLDQAWMQIARCYEATEAFDEAATHYQKIYNNFKKKPAAKQALYRRGVLLRDRLGDVVAAKEVFQRLAEDYPMTPEGRESTLALGRCELILGNLDGADRVFREALEAGEKRDGFWLQALLGRADIAYFQGRFEEASSLLEGLDTEELPRETMKDPAFNDGLRRRLTLSEYAGTEGEALASLAQAELLTIQGEDEKAFGVLDSLVVNRPDDPLTAEAMYEKGLAALRLGRNREGIACFDTLASRFPAHLLADRALERSGWIHEQAGRPEEALERYEAILEDYPHSFTADDIRGRIRSLEAKGR